ncbi:MAG: hypothetical protein APR54_10410 [Candidatus Cloacimonas sp. SDB]|nr:MAG: hypothetical protein APR54_10410 [Candidatus Cloacimonas sp. SDB]
MRKIILLILIMSLGAALNSTLNQRGFVRSYLGILSDDESFSIAQNTFDLRLDYRKNDLNLYVNPVLKYDNLSEELTLSLRQSYIDIYFADFDLRIGKQQIVWGKADGVFITDVISPRDLSEFIMPDFEEIRIGINALKFDYYLGNSTLEAIWIPTFQSTIQPDAGSIWFPETGEFQQPVQISEPEKVAGKFSNSDVAVKFSHLGSLLDLELMTAYLWDDTPAQHKFLQVDSSLLIIPKYHRLPMAGASFSKAISGAVARMEAAYYFEKRLHTADLITHGICRKDYLHYLIGYDHNWFNVDVSFQFVQEFIRNYEDIITKDEFTNTLTMMLNKTFLRETMTLNIFSYYGLNDDDALLRLKLSYDFSGGLNILAGYNLFTGDTGNFGQFNDNDMAYLKVRLDF